MNPDCVFCQKVMRGETTVVRGVHLFEPLNPYVPGHMLAIPEKHIENPWDDPVEMGFVFQVVAGGIPVDTNLLMSYGEAATQTVKHLHLHILPRGPQDGLGKDWPWNRPEKENNGD